MKVFSFRRLTALTRIKLRSVSLRFGLAYAVLFIGSAMLFLSFIWWGTVGLIERQTEQSITSDAHLIFNALQLHKDTSLSTLINERLEQDIDDNALYLLVNKNGKRITGNLIEWPSVIKTTHSWYTILVKRVDIDNVAKVRAYDMPGGERLLIGRDMRGLTELSHMLTKVLLWVCVMIALLAFSGGLLTRRLLRRIISSISRTTSAITQGDMTRRLPVHGQDKELDAVSATVNEMLDRIARLMDGVKQVSNSIAHDLRTPLTRARNQLEEAVIHATNEDELRAVINQTIRGLDHLTNICSALLRIAQIEAGARRSAFTQFDFVAILQDIIEFYEPVAEEENLKLAHSFPETLMFFGDRTMFQQAVVNLVDNAIKFSPAGGVITLSLKVISPLPDQKSSHPQMELIVEDQGTGMTEADMARATERFFRADQARNTPGSGLGLSLVQAIVQLHGGTISLSSANPGLRVVITAPLSLA
ncbi:HAMP domain-containing sensor histidine kinase [Acetobacter sp. DsW_059]|uniref:sensor histidine kinase n=1 Tax=Acetobacter sp. DsW_059 TaxID=1670661 RepID=UPI000A39B55B|nr:HAMP domain-containing sensor histidine kinase [Acetobacter sp. DsW_059]OUJ11596.1 hypothetical protein HK25_00745 [Acetobacter sp. DsW_059]